METAIKPARLVEIRATAHATPRSRFVDPREVHQVQEILRRRGETWATSVLGRDLARRSRLLPAYPWLEDHELTTLRLADLEEHRAAFDALVEALDEEAGEG